MLYKWTINLTIFTQNLWHR